MRKPTLLCSMGLVIASGLLAAAPLMAGKPTPTPTPTPPPNPAIVYTASVKVKGQNYSHLFTINADGSRKTDITPDSLGHRYPVWSPDGTRIAHMISPTAGDGTHLYTVKPDGKNLTFLCHLDEQVIPRYFTNYSNRYDWSPDMRWIVFGGQWREPLGPMELWAVDVSLDQQGQPRCDFVQLTQAVNPEDDAHSPTWSPVLSEDATHLYTQIAYEYGYCNDRPTPETCNGMDHDLAFMDVWINKSTGELTTGATYQMERPATIEFNPDWDATGTKVGFAKRDTAGIYSVIPGEPEVLIHPDFAFSPRWSPDGRLLATERHGGAVWRLCADGTGAVPITGAEYGAEKRPDWNPNWQYDLPPGTCP